MTSKSQSRDDQMAQNIMISGQTLTGKTMVAIALASKLRDNGKSVGYFKPVGKKSFERSHDFDVDVDEDALVMKDVLDLSTNLGCICPVVRTHSSYDEFLKIGHDNLLEKIQECYNKAAEGKEIVLLEGTKAPWHLLHVGLSTPQIAKHFDCKVICLVNFPDVSAIDDVLHQRDLFKQHGIDHVSVILNMVPPMLKSAVTEDIIPFLRKEGVTFCGVVYKHRELFSPSLGEIKRALDGEMLIGEDMEDILIDQFQIGSMGYQHALKWFRRAKDKAVITGGDRSDICLAALETDTNLLILTGGLGPDIRTISKAKEKEVPIMMTAHDTYTTGKIVDDLVGTVTAENKKKIRAVEKIIGENVSLECIGL
ncbi:MAG: phosphotransacetylase family protein [Candidatus Thorarchaeota archaeon]|nr:phosphotransacetylase family protein [Candidatus Thorarchaeota archaeon]